MITNFMPYVILMTLRLGDATPILSASHSSRALFHLNPTLDKRTLFNVVDISDQGQQTFLQEAQKEAVDIAGIALKYMDDPAYADYLYRWFGTHEDVHDNVQGVFTNFLGGNENSEGSIVLGEVTVWQDDYWIPKNGDTPFCTREKDGRTGTAYYSPRDDKPAMHYCDKFFERKGKADYLANDCASIANHIDTTTTTRAYRGADVLHEFMHFEKVGKAQYDITQVHLAIQAEN